MLLHHAIFLCFILMHDKHRMMYTYAYLSYNSFIYYIFIYSTMIVPLYSTKQICLFPLLLQDHPSFLRQDLCLVLQEAAASLTQGHQLLL